ncbi:MAG: hypothetical protein ACREPB_02710, partial [Arenimonas sp.]
TQRCSKEYRERVVRPAGPNETVVALESYLACVWVFVPGDGNDGRTSGDGGVNVGPGLSGNFGKDISEKACTDLVSDIDKLKQKQRELSQERQALDTALKDAFEIADRARVENRAAQTIAATDRQECNRVRLADETQRYTLASQRCRNRGLRGEAFMDCVDLEAAGISSTSYTTQVGNVCYVRAANSTSLASRTESASLEADRQATAIFNERIDVARELGRVSNELKRYQDEKKNRCP